VHIINRPLERAQQDATHPESNTSAAAPRFDGEVGALLKRMAPAVHAAQRARRSRSCTTTSHWALGAPPCASRTTWCQPSSGGRSGTERDRREPITLGVAEPFVTTLTRRALRRDPTRLRFILDQAYASVLQALAPRARRVAVPLVLMVPFCSSAA
jgi:sec-independent protein translocase protein TatC